MVDHAFDLDGQKGADSDMKSHGVRLFGREFPGEMKARGRGGDGAGASANTV